MRLLLDTVAFIRYSQEELPPYVLRVLQKPSTEVLVSMVTPGETALKPRYHDDPFHRMLISQAPVEACPIVSSDRRLPLSAREGLKTIRQN